MNRKKRNRRRALQVLFFAFLALLALLVRFRYAPYIREAAKNRVVNAVSNAINDAVNEQIAAGTVDYSSMALLEKDADGRITAVRTNMAEANRLKTETMALLSGRILETDTKELSVPMGNVLLPGLFSGRGPRIPVKIVSLTNTDAGFSTSFTQAGINQTLQQVTLTVAANVTVLTPVGTESVRVETDVVVSETVIVGTVPDSYFSMD